MPQLSWIAFDFATTLLKRRGIADEELQVLHVAAPKQKQKDVPQLLRPETLEGDVERKNIPLSLNLQWVVEEREPDVKCGDTVTAMANRCVYGRVSIC